MVGHDPYHDFQVKPFQEIILEEAEIIGSHASTRQEMCEVLSLVEAGENQTNHWSPLSLKRS